jgi:hypothetical protein
MRLGDDDLGAALAPDRQMRKIDHVAKLSAAAGSLDTGSSALVRPSWSAQVCAGLRLSPSLALFTCDVRDRCAPQGRQPAGITLLEIAERSSTDVRSARGSDQQLLPDVMENLFDTRETPSYHFNQQPVRPRPADWGATSMMAQAGLARLANRFIRLAVVLCSDWRLPAA